MYPHDDGSAYVNLWWNPVAGATSYNVAIYNGHEYQYFNVGNVTHWTSEGKGIWPTSSEVSSGKYQLHTDGSGTELAQDPSTVYHNAYLANGSTGTDYGQYKIYWFRIQAVTNNGGTTETTDVGSPFNPSVPAYVNDEGEAPTMVPLSIGDVDGATGNFVLQDTDLTTNGYGPQISVDRTYNQNQSGQSGPFGHGWTLGYQTHLVVSSTMVTLVSPDGSTAYYWKNPDGTYTSPPGQITWRLTKTTDSSGNDEYDLTLDDNTVEHFVPSASGSSTYRLQYVADPNSNHLTLTYNSSNQLTGLADQSGNHTATIAYNTDGTISTITDKNGQTWTYGYDSNGNLTSVTDPLGKVTKYAYTNGELTGYTDPNGNTYTISYDSNGRVTGETDPAQKTENISYGTGSVTYTDKTGIKTIWTYDHDHLTLTKQLDPTGLNRVWKYEYSDGTQRTYGTYNEFGEPLWSVDPNGGITKYTYDDYGQTTGITDPKGNTTGLTYGTNTSGSSSSPFNGLNHDVTKVTTPQGTYHFQYDTNHNQLVNKAPQAEKQDTSYNTNGTVDQDVTVPVDNPLENNSFESWSNGLPTNWTQGGASHTNKQSSNSKFGGSSWGITGASGTVELYPNSAPDNISTGASFTIYAYATSQAAANSTHVKINFFNSSGTYIGEVDGPSLGTVKKWTKLTVTADPKQFPAGTASYRAVIDTAPTGSDEVDFDAAAYNANSALAPMYNAFVNGSFPTDTHDWTGVGTSLQLSNSTTFGEDANSVEIANPSGWAGIEPSDSNQFIPYVQGQTYTFGAFVKGSGAGSTYLALRYYDSNKNYINEIDSTAKPSGTFAWKHLFVTLGNVPSNTAYVVPELMTAAASGGNVYADDFYLTFDPQNTSYTYDANGNQLSQTDPLGDTTKNTYDNEDNPITVTDPNGNTMSMTYDADHQLLTQTSPILKEQNTYDNNGNVTKYTETSSDGSQTETTSNQYNSLNEESSTTDGLNRTTKYTYDADGRLTNTALPDNHNVSTTYNAAGDPVSVSVDGNVVNQSGYDNDSQLTSIQGGGTSTTFKRDADGNITSQTDSVGSQTYTYNGDNALTSSALTVGGTTVSTTNDLNSEDKLVRIKNGSSTVAQFGYNDEDQTDSISLGNGIKASYRYDGAHRISDVIISSSNGVLAAYAYTYDKNGNVTKITDEQTGSTLEQYSYDSENRLTSETDANNQTTTYEYDALGNLTKKTVGSTITTYTYDAANELTAVNGQAYTYDPNGDLTGDGKYTYKWNELGELTEV